MKVYAADVLSFRSSKRIRTDNKYKYLLLLQDYTLEEATFSNKIKKL